MLEQRNQQMAGHILTIEDPIEFLFNEQEVGRQPARGRPRHADACRSALKNALRQAPDVILIGEIRDRETMTAAIAYALSGHLVLSTLHANNSYHALEPDPVVLHAGSAPGAARRPRRRPARDRLAAPACARVAGGRMPAVEVLLNTKLISELIEKGDFSGIKEAMEKSLAEGSQTFEQDLARLIDERHRSPATKAWPTPTRRPTCMWRLQNDMTPVVARSCRRRKRTSDQPSFTEITIDVRPEEVVGVSPNVRRF